MAKIKILIATLCLLLVPSFAFAEEVYNDSTIEIVPMDGIASVSGSAEPQDGQSDTDAYAPLAVTLYANSVVYDSGIISTQYLDFARGLLKYVPFSMDYVFYRSGQYEYTFAYGDYSDGFGGDSTVYRLYLGNNFNNTSYTVSHDASFSLSVGNSLVYSNVSPYPNLEGSDYSHEITFALSAFICMLGVLSIIRYVPSLVRR